MNERSSMMILANCEGEVGMKAAQVVFERGGAALDAVEAGIRVVEADNSVVTVGRGGAPDLLGVVSCDAAVMDGATGRAGAVGNLRGFLYAISVARKVIAARAARQRRRGAVRAGDWSGTGRDADR
jgi:beta-aspartyl-peptidase (threonine type)